MHALKHGCCKENFRISLSRDAFIVKTEPEGLGEVEVVGGTQGEDEGVGEVDIKKVRNKEK